MDPSSLLVARVVPDVTGLDKQFDYLVPEPLRARVAVGSMVRVPLHGRRVGGWVVALGPPDGVGRARPAGCRWPSGRESVRRRDHRPGRVGLAGGGRPAAAAVPGRGESAGDGRLAAGGRASSRSVARRETPATLPRLVRATADQRSSCRSSSRRCAAGPTLVIHPSVDEARRLAARLRRSGYSTARASRRSGLAPRAGSTWWSAVAARCGRRVRDCARSSCSTSTTRRCRRNARRPGTPAMSRSSGPAAPACRCVLVSPCPSATASALGAATRCGDRRSPTSATGWPILELVDRTDEEPWKRSLLTLAADPAPPQSRPAGRLRAQHHGPGAAAGVPHVPVAAALRAMRGSGRSGRRRLVGVPPLRHRAARSCARTAVPGRCR